MELQIVYTCLAILFVLSYKLIFKSRKCLPPSPPSLPIIGHLLYLKEPLHHSFDSLSKQYGPILSLRIGSRHIVIVSSPTLVQECFTNQNDIVFANRPRFLASKLLAYNNTTIGTAPYGVHWRNVTRILTAKLLSSNCLSSSKDVRQDEIRRLVIQLAREYPDHRDGFKQMNFKCVIEKTVMNNIIEDDCRKKVLYYEDYANTNTDDGLVFQEIMEDVLNKSGAGNRADCFPLLKWVSSGYIDKVKEVGARMDSFIEGLVVEHRTKQMGETMIDYLLSLHRSNSDQYSDTTIKGLVQSTLVGGTDTSIVTITWAMINLLNNPEVYEKARSEIDTKVGHNRFLNESDLPNLNYLLSETFRLSTAIPLLVPHYSSEDCVVGGYHIPRNTILLINSWSIHRNPEIWDDPTSFKPERFENVDRVDQYKLMPFGVGRRACPGATLALRAVGLILGTLVQCFDWKRVTQEKIDMSESTGLVMHNATPFQVLCKTRPFVKNLLGDVA